MRSLVVVLVGSLARTAAAEAVVEGEVSAGAGADHAVADAGDAGGFMLANGRLLAQVTRSPRALEERGLHICSLDSVGCMWLWTSLDPDATDGAGVDASTRLLYAAAGEGTSALHLDAHAWAGAAGWRIEGRTAFQPTTSLRDRFWRSNRGVLQHDLAFAIPAMWSLGTKQTQLSVMTGTVKLGWRAHRDGDSWQTSGFDRDIAVHGARVQTKHATVDLITMRYAELGVAERIVGATTYGTSVISIDVDVLAIDLRLPHAVAVTGRAGFADRTPLAPFEQTGSSSHSYGPGVFAPSYWLEARRGALDGSDRGVALAIGAGSWLRLDPTGHAVDAGQLATAAAAVRRQRFSIRADLQLGRLRRVLEGNLAPPDLAAIGTRTVMGRAAVQASVGVTRTVSVSGTAWLEHSDRDDPRWTSPAVGAATHAGGDLVAVWRFRKTRR